MLRNNRTGICLAASAACIVMSSALFTFSLAAPPPGKGGGGGSSPPPTLPVDLEVRYRVQFIPLHRVADPNHFSYHVFDTNDVHEVVGSYRDENGIDVGFYYDADTDTVLTANQMISDLPNDEWIETFFHGINNHGEIVGGVKNSFGLRQCMLVCPNLDSDGNKDGTYNYQITSPLDADGGKIDSYFTQINDWGDIVGISWDDEFMSTSFAYQPGLNEGSNFAFFGAPGVWWDSMKVTNTRLGAVLSGGEMSWFDFSNKEESLVQFPANVSRLGYGWGLSNDGQFTVNEALVQKKGKNVSYRYTPGIMVSRPDEPDEYVWQGNLDDGYTTLVNSAVGTNPVGDVIGFNPSSRVRWLRHADRPDWGYLDLGEMVVFSSDADAELWSLINSSGVRVFFMSDRDQETKFGMLAGGSSGLFVEGVFVLIPEFVATAP